MKKTYSWNVYGLTDYAWDVRMCIAKKKGMDAAARIVDPLTWFINTGRITMPEAKNIVTIKPYVMARLLTAYEMESVQSAVDAIKEKISKA